MEAKHTALPWTLKPHGVIVGGPMRQYTNGAAQDQIVMACIVPEDNADRDSNAALIVRAVNAHDDLVTLLKACDNKLQAMCTYHSGPAAQSIHAFREKIAAALAKAGAA